MTNRHLIAVDTENSIAVNCRLTAEVEGVLVSWTIGGWGCSCDAWMLGTTDCHHVLVARRHVAEWMQIGEA